MSAREAVIQALRLLWAHPMRSALTLFGLVWGTAAVIFLMSWGRGTQTMLDEAFSRSGKNMGLVFAGKVSENFSPAVDRRYLWFTLDDVEALRARARIPELVAGESRRYVTAAFRQRGLSAESRGVEPEGVAIRGVRVASGRLINRSDVDHRRRVLVVGQAVRKKLLGAEGRIGSWVRLDGTPFQVVGILDRVGTQLSRDGDLIDEQLWVPLSTHLSLWPDPMVNENVIRMMLFRVRDRADIGEAKLEIRGILADRLRVSPGDDEAIAIWSPIEMLARLPTNQQTAVNLLIAMTTLLIGGIGILSMMLDSVRERRPEIGIRLAVGASRRDILFQFFLETFVIVLLGGLLGVALGVGGSLFLGSEALRGGLDPALRDLIPIPELSAVVMAVAVGVMGFVGVTAGLVPAWRAAQVDPAETLRDE
jgi:putative ABC transport system permease protein